MQIIILENTKYINQEELFEKVNQYLLTKNLVKSSFLGSIINREKEFPTGLSGSVRNIAIPHTDPKHVKTQGFVVVKNDTPIKFKNMGNTDNIIFTKLIIFILANKQSEHLDQLKKVLALVSVKDLPKGKNQWLKILRKEK